MASNIGQIGEFNSTGEDAVSYVERFDMFLSANGVDDAAKKRAIFRALEAKVISCYGR